jgi:aryl-alcohol dehydrogenase-like predicted oxidoreductase
VYDSPSPDPSPELPIDIDPGNRNDLVITTKLNWGGANGEVLVNNHGLSRKHIIEGLRASLKRLDLEYVDVVYAHRPDRLTPMEETVRAFNHVIETKGWALYWGTSEWAADEIAEACGIAKQLGLIGPIVEQPQYNLLARTKVEGEFQRLYSRFGLGLTTFSPLKFGVLSGKYNDSPEKPPAGSRFAEGDDKFVSGMREAYGNRDWREMIESAIKLKVCHLSFCLSHRQRQHDTKFLQLKRKLLTRYSPSQTNSASAKRSFRLPGVSRTPTFRPSLRARRGPSKSSRTARR